MYRPPPLIPACNRSPSEARMAGGAVFGPNSQTPAKSSCSGMAACYAIHSLTARLQRDYLLKFGGKALLLGKLWLAHVGKESGMGRSALGIVGAGFGQTEGSVHGQPDIKGVAVILAVILPPADGTQGERLGRLQS